MNKINAFFLPFNYFYITRIKSKSKLLSWVMIYFIPLILILSYSKNINISDVISFFISCCLVYTLYEIGYIYNDTETIKNEDNPTLRLNIFQIEFYEKRKYEIYSCRLLISLIITILLLLFFNSTIQSVLCAWSVLFLYAIYNSIRNRFNLVIHFCLVSVRYFSPIYIVTNDLSIIGIVILLFPIINLIERCGEKRFSLTFFQNGLFKNKDRLRIFYYLFVCLIYILIERLSLNKVNFLYILPLLYFIVYRTISPIIFRYIIRDK